ncbi:hypothetical protein [Bradyrhizobium sp.]|jgi:hypothetical protein|uniref:hypothetical protein n=1 Tax=Bradyrhizobium sp. TaxID=376 RepID=UPI003C1C1234
MTSLSLRKVLHPQARNNHRVILKTEHGEFEIGSIGVQTFTSTDTSWTWGIDTVMPMRDDQAEGRGADRNDCMVKFRKAWESYCKQPGWLDEFLAMKRKPR